MFESINDEDIKLILKFLQAPPIMEIRTACRCAVNLAVAHLKDDGYDKITPQHIPTALYDYDIINRFFKDTYIRKRRHLSSDEHRTLRNNPETAKSLRLTSFGKKSNQVVPSLYISYVLAEYPDRIRRHLRWLKYPSSAEYKESKWLSLDGEDQRSNSMSLNPDYTQSFTITTYDLNREMNPKIFGSRRRSYGTSQKSVTKRLNSYSNANQFRIGSTTIIKSNMKYKLKEFWGHY